MKTGKFQDLQPASCSSSLKAGRLETQKKDVLVQDQMWKKRSAQQKQLGKRRSPLLLTRVLALVFFRPSSDGMRTHTH
jgi:hypothetical protein